MTCNLTFDNNTSIFLINTDGYRTENAVEIMMYYTPESRKWYSTGDIVINTDVDSGEYAGLDRVARTKLFTENNLVMGRDGYSVSQSISEDGTWKVAITDLQWIDEYVPEDDNPDGLPHPIGVITGFLEHYEGNNTIRKRNFSAQIKMRPSSDAFKWLLTYYSPEQFTWIGAEYTESTAEEVLSLKDAFSLTITKLWNKTATKIDSIKRSLLTPINKNTSEINTLKTATVPTAKIEDKAVTKAKLEQTLQTSVDQIATNTADITDLKSRLAEMKDKLDTITNAKTIGETK